MLNPFGSDQDSGSYVDLRKRILNRVQSTKIEEQIIEMAQKAFEDALAAEKVVLSQPEKKRLFSQIMRTIFDDMLGRLGGNQLPL
jgi:hypothetical protein